MIRAELTEHAHAIKYLDKGELSEGADLLERSVR